MTKATPPNTALQGLERACNYTVAAIDVFEHGQAPVVSAQIIAEQLLNHDGLSPTVRKDILAIVNNLKAAKYLLDNEVDQFDIELERWKETLEKAAGEQP